MASDDGVASEVSTAVANLNDHLATALKGPDGATAAAADGGSNATIITLAGENRGATMEAEDLVVVSNADAEENDDDDDDEEDGEEESVVRAYANSNYQAVNNSVLVAGSCNVNDPGVHVVVVEHVDEIRDYEHDGDGADQEF